MYDEGLQKIIFIDRNFYFSVYVQTIIQNKDNTQ